MIIINESQVASRLAHREVSKRAEEIKAPTMYEFDEDGFIIAYKKEFKDLYEELFKVYLTIITFNTESFDAYRKESIKWSAEDFVNRAVEIGSSLSIEEAQSLLETMIADHDAGTGVNWSVLDYYIDNKNSFV